MKITKYTQGMKQCKGVIDTRLGIHLNVHTLMKSILQVTELQVTESAFKEHTL